MKESVLIIAIFFGLVLAATLFFTVIGGVVSVKRNKISEKRAIYKFQFNIVHFSVNESHNFTKNYIFADSGTQCGRFLSGEL